MRIIGRAAVSVRLTWAVVVVVLSTSMVGADLYVLDPHADGVPTGTELSGYYPYVYLWAPETAGTSVYSVESPFSGNQVFGYDSGFGLRSGWHYVLGLRGDFSAPVDWVSVSFESDTIPILEIYDLADNLLGSVTGSYGNVTLRIADPIIAYFIARTPFMGNDQGEILTIEFNVVPEPTTLALAGVGALIAATIARKRRAAA